MAGISNHFIEYVLKSYGAKNFQGVFSNNNIPVEIASMPYSSTIINYASAVEKGTHFILILADLENIVYIDPLALPPLQENISNFISCLEDARPARETVYIATRVQDFSSKHCGFYCIYFAMLFQNVDTVPLLGFETDVNKLVNNDATVVENICLLLK